MTTFQRDARSQDAFVCTPTEPLQAGSQIVVGPDEVGLVMLDGRLQTTLGTGTHTLAVEGLATPDVYLIATAPKVVRFGGPIPIRDPRGPSIQLRCFGVARVRVTDPVAFAINTGMAGAPIDRYIATKLLAPLRDAVAERVLARGGVLDVMLDPETAVVLRQAIETRASMVPGTELVDVGDMQLNVSDADAATLQALNTSRAAPASPAPPAGPRPGASVFARWTDGQWYPATVVAVEGGNVQVDWEGNPNTAWLPADHVRPKP